MRGGVVDVFPAGDVYPVRIEFVGDTVESIRRFDPATQRSIETLNHALVVPVREHLTDASPDGVAVSDRSATIFDYTVRRNVRWFVSEVDAVDAAGLKHTAQLESGYDDAVLRNPIAPEPVVHCGRVGRRRRTPVWRHQARGARARCRSVDRRRKSLRE